MEIQKNHVPNQQTLKYLTKIEGVNSCIETWGLSFPKGPDGGENGVASLVFLGVPQKIKGTPTSYKS